MDGRWNALLALWLSGCSFDGPAGALGGGDGAPVDGAAPEVDAAPVMISVTRGGPVEVLDTQINEGEADADHGTQTFFAVDVDYGAGGSGPSHGLLRFDITGAGEDQIPGGSTIEQAVLILAIALEDNDGGNPAQLCEMLTSWSETTTWSDYAAGPARGVDYDQAACAAIPETLGDPEFTEIPIEVTASIQRWVDGKRPNHGWIARTDNNEGVSLASSEAAMGKPRLEVTFYPPGLRLPR